MIIQNETHQEIHYALLDMNGRSLWEGTISGSSQREIDMSKTSRGIYILTAKQAGKSQQQKLIWP